MTRTIAEWRSATQEWLVDNPPPPGTPVGNRLPREPAEHEHWLDWTRRLHEAGFPIMRWPSRWGGSDATAEESQAVTEVLMAAGAPLPVTDVAANLVAEAITHHGTDEQKQRFLPGIAAGVEIWTQLFSEPNAGSDLAGLTTRAVRDGDTWVITGQKVWNTYATIAHYGFLIARTGTPSERHRGLSVFLVPMSAPGVTVRAIKEATGGDDFAEVFLDEVSLDSDMLLGEPGGGWGITMSLLESERMVVGRMVAMLDSDIDRMVSVLQHDHSPAGGAFRLSLGQIMAEAAALRALFHSSSRGTSSGPTVKVLFSELNVRFHRLALDVLASPVVVPDGWALRWHDSYLYSFAYTISGGANEVLRNVIAQRVGGLPKP